MASTINVADLAQHLTEILRRVRATGEQFMLEQDGELVATLGPLAPQAGITPRELVARLGDLPLPGEGFADDLEVVQAAQPQASQPTWPN